MNYNIFLSIFLTINFFNQLTIFSAIFDAKIFYKESYNNSCLCHVMFEKTLGQFSLRGLWDLQEIEDVASYEFKEPYIFISLGRTCECAHYARVLGVRKLAFPFDWLVSDIDGLCRLLENDFKDFIKPEYLQEITQYQPWNERKVRNHFYNIDFLHDFKINQPWEKTYQEAKKKLDRRIMRFKAACTSGKFIDVV